METAGDDGVREVHGVRVGEATVHIHEEGDRVVIGMLMSNKALSTAQARYLSERLLRLARRIEHREQGTNAAPQAKGAFARAEALSPERRSEIARKAANARHHPEPVQ